ncbi:ABC-F family ATP-binding cassette domain-containing protein, partial [Patescibacteria group bacterium]|nr:ABC-F family ATP-binding cassette domain-containing protein [Patescibacteria group bacterium]
EFLFEAELVGELLEKQLENDWESYKIDTLVAHTEFNNYDPYQQIASLSLGQKMKLKIIETMLQNPTVLLIDEPTNHLDIEGIMWFENYVKNLKIPACLISHDRQFLNNTVNEIWEIENKKILRFTGNYDYYTEQKLKLINKWNEEYTAFVKRKAQLETLLTNVKKIKDGSKRSGAVSSAKKRMDREITRNKKEEYKSVKIKKVEFTNKAVNGKLMIKFEDVSKKYNENFVFENINFEIRGGEKVWLFGPNGAGKSTLIKLIMKKLEPTKGSILIGENIKIGYFAQDQDAFEYSENLLETFIKHTGADLGGAYSHLNKFLFDRESASKRIFQLSPGQRARFAFAIFAYGNYDMLILDEPANHLDIETKEVIEQSLAEYKGTLLLVSHDRFFVERVGITGVLNLKNGELKSY